MGRFHMSRTARISLLLAIDTVFFLVEIVVGSQRFPFHTSRQSNLRLAPIGYAVGSLALVADSFHMLKYASCNPSPLANLYFLPAILLA
jgi:zinc transporter 1